MENKKKSSVKKLPNYVCWFSIYNCRFCINVGGDTGDETSFNPEIFNFQRITLAPILILTGFVIEVFAIMYKQKNKFIGTHRSHYSRNRSRPHRIFTC